METLVAEGQKTSVAVAIPVATAERMCVFGRYTTLYVCIAVWCICSAMSVLRMGFWFVFIATNWETTILLFICIETKTFCVVQQQCSRNKLLLLFSFSSFIICRCHLRWEWNSELKPCQMRSLAKSLFYLCVSVCHSSRCFTPLRHIIILFHSHTHTLSLSLSSRFILRRTDPANNGWATTWMSGIALGVLGISLISGAIFALYWARKNKRNMKASYPGECTVMDIDRRLYDRWAVSHRTNGDLECERCIFLQDQYWRPHCPINSIRYGCTATHW